LRPGEFWALDEVSFELRRGECLGLIGRNGAGKTTLLKMLNGLIKPDKGRIEIRGRVGALIALGAGFNPILTGRENIYVNAAVLGMSKAEVDQRIDEIIEFSEIREFIDSPVQTYSSGMTVRLGFSVAAILIKPEVLFLDEVLAVGDIGFTIKCLNTVRRLTQDAAVVFVSHNMQYISTFCTRVIVLEKGVVGIDAANPAEGIDRYYSLIERDVQISGTGEAYLEHFEMLSGGILVEGKEPVVRYGVEIRLFLGLTVLRSHCNVCIMLVIHDEGMGPIQSVPITDSQGQPARFPSGSLLFELPLGVLELNAGRYFFVVSVSDADTNESLARIQGVMPFRVIAERMPWGKIVRPTVPLSIKIRNSKKYDNPS
jgi:lipopolysaccharide transport system ATP-binding protein